jgi:hypothetical protein
MFFCSVLQPSCLLSPFLNPPAHSSSKAEVRSIATFKLTLLVLTEILDDVEALDMFERSYDDPATVDMCKLESHP